MNVLLSTYGSKKSIDKILLLCEKELSEIIQIGRKEFCFAAGNITGKFQTAYPNPITKELDMIFTGADESQIGPIEEIGGKIFGNARTSIDLRVERPIKKLHLTNVLNQEFITALHLNLSDNAGIIIGSGNKKLEILNGLYGKQLAAAISRCILEEKSISRLLAEANCALDEIFALPTKIRIAGKGNRFPMPLKADDLGWWNTFGAGTSDMVGYTIKNNTKYYKAEASAGFKTFKGNFSNLFSDKFLEKVQSLNMINSLILRKHTDAKYCTLSMHKNNNGAYEGLTSVQATIKRALGTKKTSDPAVHSEIVRLLNAAYGSVMRNVDLEAAFAEYILNNANSTCICGKKFEDTLKKEIVEIGCYSPEKHLMHRSCRNKWVKKHPAEKFKWMESICPFCQEDSSVYEIPWKNRKIVWKNNGF